MRTGQRQGSDSEKHQIVEKGSSSHLKIFALMALLGLVSLAGGCAALSALPVGSVLGSPNSSSVQIYNTTQARLQERNFIVIKTNLIGESKGFSLLGILPIVPAKFTKAMSRLYMQAEMQPGRSQTIVNLIMEQESTYLILFSIPRTSIRADLIEFIPPNATNIPPPLAPEPAKTKAD
jgi:hypothetical protein